MSPYYSVTFCAYNIDIALMDRKKDIMFVILVSSKIYLPAVLFWQILSCFVAE